MRSLLPRAYSISLILYSDASCVNNHSSISGWCIFLAHALISWKSKKKARVSKSSIKYEYQVMPLFDLVLFGFVDYWENLDFFDMRLLLFMPTSVIELAANPRFYEQIQAAVYLLFYSIN